MFMNLLPCGSESSGPKDCPSQCQLTIIWLHCILSQLNQRLFWFNESSCILSEGNCTLLESFGIQQPWERSIRKMKSESLVLVKEGPGLYGKSIEERRL